MADIPYKLLSHGQASDLAAAMARGDAKRLADVLARVGGIDHLAFSMAVAPEDNYMSLVAQNSLRAGRPVSGALVIRALARAPDQVFDYLVGDMAHDRSTRPNALGHGEAWARIERWGGGEDPRVVRKILAACARAQWEWSDWSALQIADILDGASAGSSTPMQAARVDAKKAECRQACVDFFVALPEEGLLGLIEALGAPAQAHLKDVAQSALILVKQALSAKESAEIGKSMESGAPARKARL